MKQDLRVGVLMGACSTGLN